MAPLAGATRCDAAQEGGPAPKPAAVHSIRLQARAGVADDAKDESSLQATYFSRFGWLWVFANGELVYDRLDYSHAETEVNLGLTLSRGRPWLDPFRLTGRFETDQTSHQTLSGGVQLDVTDLPPLRGWTRRGGVAAFVQYYPLKSDDHRGDQDLYVYYSIPIWRPRVSLRGFSRYYLFSGGDDEAIFVEDLIVALTGKVDVYLRHANVESPRESGLFVGIRYLLRF